MADFRSDPLVCHGKFPVRTGAEILDAAQDIQGQMESIDVPLLILHGTGDRITDPRGSWELYTRARSADKTLKLYQGLYHDLLHEPEWGKISDEILDWLGQRGGAVLDECTPKPMCVANPAGRWVSGTEVRLSPAMFPRVGRKSSHCQGKSRETRKPEKAKARKIERILRGVHIAGYYRDFVVRGFVSSIFHHRDQIRCDRLKKFDN